MQLDYREGWKGTAYIQRINGRWEATFTPAGEDRRYFLGHHYDKTEFSRKLRADGWKIVFF